VGDDATGTEVVRDLRKANVETRHIRRRRGVFTPRVIHEITGANHRFAFRCPLCRQRLPTSRPYPLERAEAIAADVSAPDVFFFDRVSGGTVHLAERFSAAGSLIVFEPARANRPRLFARAVAAADIVKYAENRIADISDVADPPSRQVRVVTRGEAGASYRVGNGAWHHSPAFPYPTVDAGGAGDWTSAGLIHALGSAKRTVGTVGDALRWAQALAAVSCGAPGARGLARQQTAAAVVQAVRFLADRKETGEQVATTTPRRSRSLGPELCSCCLLPRGGSHTRVDVEELRRAELH
jgi:sugar/nucleoside kinase (ribokinase family)